MTKNSYLRASVGILAAMALPAVALASSALAATQDEQAAPEAEGGDETFTQAQVDALVDAMETAVSALPEGASSADIQAAIALVITQQGASPALALAALAALEAKGASGSLLAAIRSVRSLQQALAGTGAGEDAGGDGLDQGPGLGLTGGSSDYNS